MAIKLGKRFHYRLWKNEPPRDKTNKMTVRPAKTQISLGICPVWSEPNEDSDQPGNPPSLIRLFALRSMGS